MRGIQGYRGIVVLATTALLAGCASTGGTFRSGVADAFLDHAPYYAGARAGDSAVAFLPIVYQRGGTHAAMFDPAAGAGSALDALLTEMNAFLGSLTGGRARIRVENGTPPDVQFGCEVDAGGDCTNGPAAPFEWGRPRLRLAVGRPSTEWIAGAASALTDVGAARAVVITLEVGQYWPQQTNWRGSKAVELGTGFSEDLRWLTSLETPVTVLQLTGALVGRDGRAVRIGAEGLLAKRTGIVASGIGAQALVSDEDAAALRTARRDDLAGRPLVWQVALSNLVSQLTGPVVAN